MMMMMTKSMTKMTNNTIDYLLQQEGDGKQRNQSVPPLPFEMTAVHLQSFQYKGRQVPYCGVLPLPSAAMLNFALDPTLSEAFRTPAAHYQIFELEEVS